MFHVSLSFTLTPGANPPVERGARRRTPTTAAAGCLRAAGAGGPPCEEEAAEEEEADEGSTALTSRTPRARARARAQAAALRLYRSTAPPSSLPSPAPRRRTPVGDGALETKGATLTAARRTSQ